MNASTMTLIAYIVVLLPLMLLGYIFARRKMFNPQHKLTMTSIVILNWILIGAVMVLSYNSNVVPGLPDSIGDIAILIPTIHGITGLLAQIFATYLVLLMWTENTPLERLVFVRIKNIKTAMRITLTLWIVTVLLGIGIYATWNSGSDTTGTDIDTPAATEEAGAEVPEPDATEDAD